MTAYTAQLFKRYAAMLDRDPVNINECNEGVRDAVNGNPSKDWGPDYTDCYNITKSGIEEI